MESEGWTKQKGEEQVHSIEPEETNRERSRSRHEKPSDESKIQKPKPIGHAKKLSAKEPEETPKHDSDFV